jgi:neutral ceramidase
MKLLAGVAEVDITPPVGVDLAGFLARTNPSTGVLDQLRAKALYLTDGNERLLLMANDLIGVPPAELEQLHRFLAGRYGIEPRQVLAGATHTHSGPSVFPEMNCIGVPDRAYADTLVEKWKQVAAAAIDSAQPASMAFAQGHALVALDRRAHGHGGLKKGEQTDDLMGSDPRLHVIQFRTADGKTLATMVRYACHAVCMGGDNRMISADCFGRMAAALEAQTGAPVLTFNGAAGDMNPRWRGDYETATSIGTILAEEAARTIKSLRDIEPQLASARVPVEIPFKHLTREEWERIGRELVDQFPGEDTRAMPLAHNGDAARMVNKAARLWWDKWSPLAPGTHPPPPAQSAFLQAVRLSKDLVLLASPAETLRDIGAIYEGLLPNMTVLVIGYANGCVGYVAPRSAYVPGAAGYEEAQSYRYYGAPAPFREDTEDVLREAAQRAYAELGL